MSAHGAVIVEVPEAEPLVGRWRTLHDPSAALGVPAHVTLLFPWCDPTDDDLGALAAIARAAPQVDVAFGAVRDFPGGVTWLAPEPDEPFRRLTAAMRDRWPDWPPYGGRIDDPVPHLTVLDGSHGGGDLAATRESFLAAAADVLPVHTRMTHVTVIRADRTDGPYRVLERLPLGAEPS